MFPFHGTWYRVGQGQDRERVGPKTVTGRSMFSRVESILMN